MFFKRWFSRDERPRKREDSQSGGRRRALPQTVSLACEQLEDRLLLSHHSVAHAHSHAAKPPHNHGSGSHAPSPPAIVVQPHVPTEPQLTTADVEQLLNRAAAATPSQNAIIAVVDRGGNILGVRTEAGINYPDVA